MRLLTFYHNIGKIRTDFRGYRELRKSLCVRGTAQEDQKQDMKSAAQK